MEFYCSNYDGKFEIVVGKVKMNIRSSIRGLAFDKKREIEKGLIN